MYWCGWMLWIFYYVGDCCLSARFQPVGNTVCAICGLEKFPDEGEGNRYVVRIVDENFHWMAGVENFWPNRKHFSNTAHSDTHIFAPAHPQAQAAPRQFVSGRWSRHLVGVLALVGCWMNGNASTSMQVGIPMLINWMAAAIGDIEMTEYSKYFLRCLKFNRSI